MERYRRRTFLCSVHRPSLALHAIAFYGVRTDVRLYLAAGRSLFHSAGVFFAEDANTVPNWRYGAFIWIAPSAFLALTWTLCWGQTRHSVRILAALFLISVPPIGVIGWANPITSAGALFPALSWAGLLLTLVFLMQLGSAHNAFIRLLPF